MTLLAQSGVYNSATQKIYAESNSTWSGLSGKTWKDWTEWSYSTLNTILWYAPEISLGSQAVNFTLNIKTDSNAAITYKVYTSLTGDYASDGVETIIEPGAVQIFSFFGRYCLIGVQADRITELPTISSIQAEASLVGAISIEFSKVDTSTLAGSSASRVLPLGKTVSRVTDVKIMPYETASPYALDVYVTNTPTSTFLIPKVVSIGTTSINIALIGVDNHARDGVVDVTVKALPEQYMDGNDLKTR